MKDEFNDEDLIAYLEDAKEPRRVDSRATSLKQPYFKIRSMLARLESEGRIGGTKNDVRQLYMPLRMIVMKPVQTSAQPAFMRAEMSSEYTRKMLAFRAGCEATRR